jgi:hypothetical protein
LLSIKHTRKQKQSYKTGLVVVKYDWLVNRPDLHNDEIIGNKQLHTIIIVIIDDDDNNNNKLVSAQPSMTMATRRGARQLVLWPNVSERRVMNAPQTAEWTSRHLREAGIQA